MKPSALASRSHFLICPICEVGALSSGGPNGIHCPMCGYAPSRSVLEALWQIMSLPDVLGSHTCEECGHPEMRLLPDRILHCPGCGSEVLPARSNGRTHAIDKIRDPRQAGCGDPDAPAELKKASERRVMPAPEGAKQ